MRGVFVVVAVVVLLAVSASARHVNQHNKKNNNKIYELLGEKTNNKHHNHNKHNKHNNKHHGFEMQEGLEYGADLWISQCGRASNEMYTAANVFFEQMMGMQIVMKGISRAVQADPAKGIFHCTPRAVYSHELLMESMRGAAPGTTPESLLDPLINMINPITPTRPKGSEYLHTPKIWRDQRRAQYLYQMSATGGPVDQLLQGAFRMMALTSQLASIYFSHSTSATTANIVAVLGDLEAFLSREDIVQPFVVMIQTLFDRPWDAYKPATDAEAGKTYPKTLLHLGSCLEGMGLTFNRTPIRMSGGEFQTDSSGQLILSEAKIDDFPTMAARPFQRISRMIMPLEGIIDIFEDNARIKGLNYQLDPDLGPDSDHMRILYAARKAWLAGRLFGVRVQSENPRLTMREALAHDRNRRVCWKKESAGVFPAILFDGSTDM